MIGGLFTTLFALLVVISGRSMAEMYDDYPIDYPDPEPIVHDPAMDPRVSNQPRQLTWNGSPNEPAFDHWACCECNGVPDQCLGICSCYSNADPANWPIEHPGKCAKYIPEIGLCRNKCPNNTSKPPITRRPTTRRPTATPTKGPNNGSKAKCERHKRTWTCAEATGPRTCCVKGTIATGTATVVLKQEDPAVYDLYDPAYDY
jgi:hypothetical protein